MYKKLRYGTPDMEIKAITNFTYSDIQHKLGFLPRSKGGNSLGPIFDDDEYYCTLLAKSHYFFCRAPGVG